MIVIVVRLEEKTRGLGDVLVYVVAVELVILLEKNFAEGGKERRAYMCVVAALFYSKNLQTNDSINLL